MTEKYPSAVELEAEISKYLDRHGDFIGMFTAITIFELKTKYCVQASVDDFTNKFVAFALSLYLTEKYGTTMLDGFKKDILLSEEDDSWLTNIFNEKE